MDDREPGPSEAGEALKVFISYSWDSPEHSDRVRALVDRLLADGVDCVLDRYVYPPPPQGWATWMRDEVASAAFVLVICSAGYNQKAQGKAAGGGAGVRFESVHILQELYDQRMWNQRFLPVLVGGAGPEQVWEPLRPYHRYEADSEDGYEDLYRRLTNQPALVRPALGQRKVLPPRNLASRATAPAARPAGPIELPWAHESGTDSFGRFAALRLGTVTHRFRWILPGEFWMGSPETETGRSGREGPRHRVTLTEGFWPASPSTSSATTTRPWSSSS